MDKLKELLREGWFISGAYANEQFSMIAKHFTDADYFNSVKSAYHKDLEIAIAELYEKCKE